jgi:hypothetical protein
MSVLCSDFEHARRQLWTVTPLEESAPTDATSMQSEVICRCDVLGTSILSALYLLVVFALYRLLEWKIARGLAGAREPQARQQPAQPAVATTAAGAGQAIAARAERSGDDEDDGMPSLASLTRDNEQAQALVKSLATTFSQFVDEKSRPASRRSPAKDAPAVSTSSPRDEPPTEEKRRRRDRIEKRRHAAVQPKDETLAPAPAVAVAVAIAETEVAVDGRRIARFAGGEDEEVPAEHAAASRGEEEEEEEDEEARMERQAGAIGWDG